MNGVGEMAACRGAKHSMPERTLYFSGDVKKRHGYRAISCHLTFKAAAFDMDGWWA